MSDNEKLRETILSRLAELDADSARITLSPDAGEREQMAKHILRGRLSLIMSEVDRLAAAENCSRLRAAVLCRKGKLAKAVASTKSTDDPLVQRWTSTAIEAYRESVSAFPSTEACYELAICYARLGCDQEAWEALCKVEDLNDSPLKPEIATLIGLLKRRASNLKTLASPSIQNPTPRTLTNSTDAIFAKHGMGDLPESVRVEVFELFHRDMKINAIKLVRQHTKLGLKEAKDAVEGLATDLGFRQFSQSSGCFIATACYGDYDHPDVVALRKFRDERLMPSSLGRLFVKIYYRLSPPAAEWLEERPWLTRVLRERLLTGIVNWYRRAS